MTSVTPTRGILAWHLEKFELERWIFEPAPCTVTNLFRPQPAEWPIMGNLSAPYFGNFLNSRPTGCKRLTSLSSESPTKLKSHLAWNFCGENGWWVWDNPDEAEDKLKYKWTAYSHIVNKSAFAVIYLFFNKLERTLPGELKKKTINRMKEHAIMAFYALAWGSSF